MSEKFQLNLNDLKAILRTIVIHYSPVLLILMNQIQNWTFDLKIVYALIISTTIDILRRYLTGNITK